MTTLSRRGMLKASGAAGGLAGILATGRAPAYAQQTTVHWLKWADFVPAADDYLRKSGLPEAEKALGIKINMETINQNDLAARATAAIQGGSGADIIMGINTMPQLYAPALADVSALCEDIAAAQGGYYAMAKANCHDGKRWVASPYGVLCNMVAWRKSWFEEAGAKTFPTNWTEYRALGKKLKDAGRPLGQCLGHTVGDAPSFCYPYLWSWGGKEVEADGKTVAINSRETIESIRFMTGFWKDAHDEGGLAWDDSSNNRAFLSGTISSTQNGASIYIESVRKPKQYMTDSGEEMRKDIRHSVLPGGPAGQFTFHTNHAMMVMGYSKNQKAATDFLRWFHTSSNFATWFGVQKGFVSGPTLKWEQHPVWNEDPVMAPFRDAAGSGRVAGHPGPSNQKAAEALNKYIIVDMYAKAVEGMAPEAAAAWAETELKKIYAA